METTTKPKNIFPQVFDFWKKHRRLSLGICIISIFGVGVCTGFAVFLLFEMRQTSVVQQVRQGGYQFINPLLECEVVKNFFPAYQPFESETRNEIIKSLVNKDKTSYAIYFRNLNNGPWFGMNEKEKFMPASLLKVPLMIAYYKESESNPDILNKSIIFDKKESLNVNQEIKPSQTLESGKPYTVKELIDHMIIYSDNEATQILLNNLPAESINKIYDDLGIDLPVSEWPKNDYMSVKSYASFFRILYNAAYLNRDMSEKALALLAASEYKNALVAGVDSEVVVAHKFGEYGIDKSDPQNPYELHDCGIVYYPGYPYLLCVMTRGRSIEDNEKTIAQISSIVYREIAERYPAQ